MATLGDDLLGTVNKLQDLVFNTIGNDSLDLPQIVRQPLAIPRAFYVWLRELTLPVLTGRCRFTVSGKVLGPREYRWPRFLAPRQWHRHPETPDFAADQRTAKRGRGHTRLGIPESHCSCAG